MAEEIKIANSTCQGLTSKFFICSEIEYHNFDCDPRVLIPFTVSGRYGLMNNDKHIVLEAKYDIILDTANSKDDLIRVGMYHYVNFMQKNGPRIYKRSTLGVINTKGDFVIPMEYKSIFMPFNSSLFSVEKKNSGSHGVIDVDNNIVVPFGKYRYIDGFSRGYARVKNHDNKWGIINERGEEVLSCIYPNIWNFYKKNYPTAIIEIGNGQRQFDFKSGMLIDKHKTLSSKKAMEVIDLNDDSDYDCHYGEFAGTYAQDVAGYSDDAINDVFEGNPDAYWNID